ncbi:MAG TPA: D-alanine--D-alanine ligase [Spirochaetia bacterium]|nr:D-alanine--D-alanine ligase [Spirochaetia bacterium]
MKDKIRVGVLFGGRSAEHEVSLQSAKNIIDALDRDKYEIVLIGIDRQGRWHINRNPHFLLNQNNPHLIRLEKGQEGVVLLPGQGKGTLLSISSREQIGSLDVVFPVLHGPYGEDGTIQGLLKLADIPFVGAGVAGSAVGMDKDIMKRLLRDAGIPSARFLVFHCEQRGEIRFDRICSELGLPLFVKPANMGSSVGISKIKEENDFLTALDTAFSFDNKILLEEAITGDEIECSVLGNQEPIASLPGRVIPQAEFYSYEAKYIDENGALLEVPASLDGDTTRRIQERAVQAFKVLCCEGMARVDFFLTPGGEILLNEINTIPGFTRISMYPKLWEASGISYPELVDRLIRLAIERFEREKALQSDRNPAKE